MDAIERIKDLVNPELGPPWAGPMVGDLDPEAEDVTPSEQPEED